MRIRYCIVIVFIFTGFYAKAQIANRFDIVIDEIMADPSPQVNLPNNEWIELRNTSGTTFNLLGWKIGDATVSEMPESSFFLTLSNIL